MHFGSPHSRSMVSRRIRDLSESERARLIAIAEREMPHDPGARQAHARLTGVQYQKRGLLPREFAARWLE